MTKSLKSIFEESLKLVDNKNVFQRDILFLMENEFGTNYNDVILYGDKLYNNEVFREKLNRLANGEPVEYIVGYASFYGTSFVVNKDTLIPRNETEELVEKTIELIEKSQLSNPKIVEVGAGSGCIAITLNKLVKGSSVDSFDISSGALEVARINNDRIGTSVNFCLGDCLTKAIEENKKYDVIISNPPYIDRDTFVQESVLKYEPHTALFADDHGLAIYERIFSQIEKVTNEHAIVAFEISPDLVDRLTDLRNKYLSNYEYSFEKAMNELVRFMFLSK